MANWFATSIVTGSSNRPQKTLARNDASVIFSVALTTALANGDTIYGPTMPAGYYLTDVRVDTNSLDSSNGLTFEAGYAGALGAFIVGATVGQGGGIAVANVPGTLGFTAATPTQLLVTITHAATTPVAGTMRLLFGFTRDP
jgi:hypothetical protein